MDKWKRIYNETHTGLIKTCQKRIASFLTGFYFKIILNSINRNVKINGLNSQNCNIILFGSAIKQSVKRVQFSWKNYL